MLAKLDDGALMFIASLVASVMVCGSAIAKQYTAKDHIYGLAHGVANRLLRHVEAHECKQPVCVHFELKRDQAMAAQLLEAIDDEYAREEQGGAQ